MAPENSDIPEPIHSHRALSRMLNDDFLAVQDDLAASDTQWRRRSLVRSFFAFAEGTLSAMKQTILAVHDRYQPLLSGRLQAKLLRIASPQFRSLEKFLEDFHLNPDELALLRERQYRLDSSGRPQEQHSFLRIPENLRFTFSLIPRLFRSDATPDVDSEGWVQFLRAVRIRNRVTHPKAPEDLDISDDEVTCILDAARWFDENAARVSGAIPDIDESLRT